MRTITLYQSSLEKAQEAVSDFGLEMALKLSEMRQNFSIEQHNVRAADEDVELTRVPSYRGKSTQMHADTY